jgi:tetratricopeptide (TPR) repeat protein
MKRLLHITTAALIFGLFSLQAIAKEFPIGYVDQFLNKLAPHAKRYPTTFDSKVQREELNNELKEILGVMDSAILKFQNDPEVLFRYAFLNAMGHNMDIAGCADKSISAYLRLLDLKPSDKRANYYFGSFLAGTTLFAKSVPYLEKSIELGEGEAHYTLAFVYIKEGKQDEALPEFKKYLEIDPNNDAARKMVNDIENKNLKVKFVATPSRP